MAKDRSIKSTTSTAVVESSQGNAPETEIMSAVQLKESEVAKIKLPSTLNELARLKTDLAPLNVTSLEDTKTYEQIKAIDLKIVKLRTGLVEIHKKVKAPYLDITTAIDAAKNEMLTEIAKEEVISKSKRKVWEDLAEAEEKRQAQIIIDRTNARNAKLATLGQTLPIEDITNMSDSLFNEHFELLQKQAEEKRLADLKAEEDAAKQKAEEKRIADESAAKLAADQARLAQQQNEMAAEANRLKAEKLEMVITKAQALGFTASGGNRVEYKGSSIYIDIALSMDQIMAALTKFSEEVKARLLAEAKSKSPEVLIISETAELKKQINALALNYSIPMTLPQTKAASLKLKEALNEFKATSLATIDNIKL